MTRPAGLTRINAVASRGTSKLNGLAEMKKNLDDLGSEISTKIGRKAGRDAAKLLQAEVMARVPYSPGTKLKTYSYRKKKQKTGQVSRTDYGHLRDQITVRLAKARKEFTITYNVGTGRAFWGFFLEYGTVNMAARPFMRPAFDSSVAAMQAVQVEELRKGIERAVKRMKVSKKVPGP